MEGDASAGGVGELPRKFRAEENGRLLRRQIPLIAAGLIRRADLGIGDHANHGCPRQSLLRIADVHALADGPLARPGMSGHRLTDDHDQG